MQWIWNAGIVGMAMAASAYADGPARAECSLNGIISLKISKIDALQAYFDKELCSSNSPALPDSVVSVLDSVGSVQNKVATTLSTTREKLFPKGLELTLTNWELGSLDEGASGNSVTISFFRDWNGGPIDQGGLAHELGHVIAGTSTDDIRSGRIVYVKNENENMRAFFLS